MTQIALILTAAATAAVLAAEHLLPWRALTGRKLHRLAAYTMGTATLLGGMTAWLLIGRPDAAQAAVGLWTIAVSGGIAVVGCYVVDALALARANERELEARREDDRRRGD